MRPTLNPALAPFRTRLGARLMLVFIGVALLPMLVGVLLSYQRARTSLVNLALSKVEQEAALTAKDLGTSLEQFSSDLLMLSNAPPVQGLLLAQDHGGRDPATGRSYDEWIDWLRQLFATTMQSKQFYQQLRFLDQTGQEVVRIEYRDGTVIVAWAESGGELEAYRVALENRASAGYFTAAQPLPRGQIAISPLTLSQAESADAPPVPIIYFSTPIYDRAGAFRGVVVSTVYAASFLQRLSVNQGQVYLADQDGFYLAHPDPSRTFGRERGVGYSVAADFPQTYATMLQSSQDAFTELDAGRAEVVALYKLHFDPLYPERYWLLIRTLPEDAVLGPVRILATLVLGVAMVVIVVVALLALHLAHGFTRPIIELTGVAEQISQADLPQLVESLGRVAGGDVTTRFELSAQPVVVRSADEVGQLGWAFNHMIASLREAHLRLAQTQEQLCMQKEAAEVANQAKSVFLASMSHELRTPLNGILGFAQILLRQRLDQQVATGLTIIEQSGEHLLTLINDILDLSKIEAGRLALTPMPLNLPVVLDGIVGIIRARAEAKHLRLIFEAPPRLPSWVEADETRLRQILLNLLGNAVKFTGQGTITLRVTTTDHQPPTTVVGATQPRSHGNQETDIEQARAQVPSPSFSQSEPSSAIGRRSSVVIFEVEDTGSGIAPDQLERIFQPFEQVGDPTRQAEGTGLGLAISRQLVRLMGGDLYVTSVLGHGSTFRFAVTLPVVAAMNSPAPERAIIGYVGPRCKLLVVDDIVSNRALLTAMLEPLGFTVQIAEDGQQALALVQQERPDLILMDRWMPILNGLEAVRQIRQIAALRKVPIIATSASVSVADQAVSRAAGYDAFLSKPIHLPQLVALLEQYLRLEWVYAAESEAAEAPAVLVPPEELAVLCELAANGDILALQARAAQLEQRDPRWQLFARRVAQLAGQFEVEQILALLAPYLPPDRQP